MEIKKGVIKDGGGDVVGKVVRVVAGSVVREQGLDPSEGGWPT